MLTPLCGYGYIQNELKSVQGKVEQCRSILTMIQQREQFLHQLAVRGFSEYTQAAAKGTQANYFDVGCVQEFKLSSSDPDRFQGRQAFRILAYEESMRKLAAKDLPKLETKIMNSIKQWYR